MSRVYTEETRPLSRALQTGHPGARRNRPPWGLTVPVADPQPHSRPGLRVPGAAMFSRRPPPFWDRWRERDTGRGAARPPARHGPAGQSRRSSCPPHLPAAAWGAALSQPCPAGPSPHSPWLRSAGTDAQRVWAAPKQRRPSAGSLYITCGAGRSAPCAVLIGTACAQLYTIR